jgi:hypothetical protein
LPDEAVGSETKQTKQKAAHEGSDCANDQVAEESPSPPFHDDTGQPSGNNSDEYEIKQTQQPGNHKIPPYLSGMIVISA